MREMDQLESQFVIQKPIVYLDQNVLDLFVKGKYLSLHDQLRDIFQVIYSDETLCEIKRSGKGANDFIKVLQSLSAYHIGIELAQPDFTYTGNAVIKPTDPAVAYQEYLANHSSSADVSEALNSFLFKFQGGNEDQTFTEMFGESKQTFAQYLENLRSATKEIETSEIQFSADQKISDALSQFSESIDFLEESLSGEFGDGTGWSGVAALRTATGFGPIELNNIEGPNILQNIWKHLKETEPYSRIKSIEEFLSLTAAQNGNRELHMFEKIQAVYNTLNTVGYHPDTQQNKQRGFTRALSDTGHASIAWFCHVVISRDERFIKKLEAALEFLGCKNQLVLLKTT